MIEERWPILEVKNINKQFQYNCGRKVTAVSDVSLKLYKGECLGVVGESGCGKTTLANIITHLENAASGKIIYNNQDITHLKGQELRQNRRKIQIILQDPSEYFNPRMKALDIVSEPITNFKLMNKSKAKQQGKELLKLVGIEEDFMWKYPHELSGGEKQRIAIARAISLNPEIIICDEATSALDVSIQEQVINLLVDLKKNKKLSYIFISHDLAVTKNISDRIAVMYMGSIVEIIHSDKLTKEALHPYTKVLLSSVFSVKGNDCVKIEQLKENNSNYSSVNAGCSFNSRCRDCVDRCFREKPQLKEVGEGHFVACFHRSLNS